MSHQNILLFFPIVDVSYCNDDFILYLGDYITSQYVKATNNYGIFSHLVHTLISATSRLRQKPGWRGARFQEI